MANLILTVAITMAIISALVLVSNGMVSSNGPASDDVTDVPSIPGEDSTAGDIDDHIDTPTYVKGIAVGTILFGFVLLFAHTSRKRI
jgi:hypothetical protein